MKVLLSIKPEYTEKIFSGVKKYEFRRQKPRSIIERVFIYESSPSKNIVGWFTIKRILSGSPEKIWGICSSLGGIGKKKFFAYCNGKRVVYALEIDRVFQFKTPMNPFEICSDFRPPQNFSYINRLSIFSTIDTWQDDCR
jgi:predicted transcriptional regulator